MPYGAQAHMNKTDRVKSFTIDKSPQVPNVDIKEILENKKTVFSPRNNGN